jgi:hypothetical protein
MQIPDRNADGPAQAAQGILPRTLRVRVRDESPLERVDEPGLLASRIRVRRRVVLHLIMDVVRGDVVVPQDGTELNIWPASSSAVIDFMSHRVWILGPADGASAVAACVEGPCTRGERVQWQERRKVEQVGVGPTVREPRGRWKQLGSRCARERGHRWSVHARVEANQSPGW